MTEELAGAWDTARRNALGWACFSGSLRICEGVQRSAWNADNWGVEQCVICALWRSGF
jgi:hypothetical protein